MFRHEDILNALSDAVLVINHDHRILYVNQAAEHFFASGASQLCGSSMEDILLPDSPFFSLLKKLQAGGDHVTEHYLPLSSPRFGERIVTVRLSSVPELSLLDHEMPGDIVAVFSEQDLAHRIDRQWTQRHSGRSMHAMASTLAHEVKNPLSGIRGAAQLIGKRSNSAADQELTTLITNEADRIRSLVERVETLAHDEPVTREPVNLHEILDHILKIAENGFARGLRLNRLYDPSLPLAFCNRDQLIQVFLNLLKNACEAVKETASPEGAVTLETSYQNGVRLVTPGSQSYHMLPLRVGFRDNGGGISEAIRDCLFDPFVSDKTGGTGIGLALVSRIINDHGGLIEFESHPGRTVFNVLLPVHAPHMPQDMPQPSSYS